MLVGVVIPMYNGARWIRQTLESVFEQSLCPAEVVVVDDGCEDESPDIVREFSGVSLIRHPGKGANQARRFGCMHITAPLVTFLDQDDLWHPDHLRQRCEILEGHSDCPAAVAAVRQFRGDEDPVYRPHRLDVVEYDPWAWFPFNTIQTPSAVVIRLAALRAAGGWPTEFLGVADYYTWLRLSVSEVLLRQRSITVGRRIHAHSHSKGLLERSTQAYLNSQTAASEKALSHRLAVHPGDADVLNRRLGLIRALNCIVKATADGDRKLLLDSALAFEEGTVGQPEAFTQSAYSTLVWYVYSALAPQSLQWQQAVLSALFGHWPDQADDSREALSSWLPTKQSGNRCGDSP